MQNNTFFGYSKPSCLIVLDKTSSTNDYIKQLLTNFKPQLPFTAIMARAQTEGRGQRGSTWIAKPNENLTTSFLFTPKNLLIKDQFILTIITSLAIYDAIQENIKENIYIKWPNDIIVNKKKIAGVLIENKISATAIKHSIIGIGINVYSTDFPIEIKHKATSLLLENFDFSMTIIDLIRVLQQNLIYYEKMYSEGLVDKLWDSYINKLYRRNILAEYSINNNIIQGKIIGVNNDGRLLLEVGSEIKKYDLKDISYEI